MKRIFAIALAYAALALSLPAQSATVTSSTVVYSAAGGEVTLNVALTFPNGAVPSFWAKPPGDAWIYAGDSETNAPTVRPSIGETTVAADANSNFGFTYFSPPANSAAFSFVLSYPAGLSGSQTLTFGADYRLDGVRTVLVVPAITLVPAVGPTIVSQPSSVSVPIGGSATFNVVATGTPAPAFQWKRGGIAISGATNASYAISAAATGDAGSYSVVVSNDSGSVTSTAAMLTVNLLTQALTFNPPSTKTYGDAAFAVSATSDSGLPVTVSVVSGPATIASGTVTLTGAGTVTLRATQAGDATRASATLDKTIAVAAQSITVTADAKTKVYGAADPGLTYTLSGGTLAGSDQLTGALARAPGEGVGTYGITQGSLTAGTNYIINYVGSNLAITAATPVVTVTPGTYTYNATAQGPVAADVTKGGSTGAVTVTYAGAGGTTYAASETAPTNAGSYTVTAGVAADANYAAASSAPTAFTIAPRPITVTATPKTKVYGVADPALTYTITSGSLVGADQLSGTLTRASGETVAGGPYAIGLGSISGAGNYAITFVGANLTITKAMPLLTWNQPASVPAGTALSATQLNALAVPAGGTFVYTPTAGTTLGQIGTTNLSVQYTPTDAANYDVASAQQIITVTQPVPVVNSATTAIATVGVAFNYTITASNSPTSFAATGLPAGLTVNPATGLISGTPTAAGVSNVALTATNSGGTSAAVSVALTVNAPPAITTPPASQGVSAGSSVTFTVVATGTAPLSYQWKKGDVAISGATSATYVINPVASSDAGSFTVTVSNVAGSVTSDVATLTTNLVAQTITFNPPATKTFGDASFAVTATSDSGLPVTVSVLSGPATITGGTVTFSGAGTVVLRASQAGDATRAAAALDKSITVGKATPVVAITPGSYTYNATAQGPVAGDVNKGGSTGAVTFTYAGASGTTYAASANAPTNAGSYTVTAAVAADANYVAASSAPTTFTIAQRAITVTAAPQTKVFGAADPTLTYSVTSGSLAGADQLTGALTRTAGETVAGGPYSIAKGTVTAGANYAITYVGANLAITPATPTVSVTAGNYTYTATPQGPSAADVNKGGSTGAVTLTYAGTGGTSYATSTTAPTNVGFYTVTAAVAADANNAAASSSATAFTIAPRSIAVTAVAKSKVFGTTDPTLTYTVSGTLVGSDQITGALTRAAGETVAGGPYAITQGSVTAGPNYTVNYTGASFTITKATPLVLWPQPSSVPAGTILSATQLNATAVPSGGSFVYTPASGSALANVGTTTLAVQYTPADASNYAVATAQQTITVTTPVPVINSATTATATVGTAFSYTIAASSTPTSFAATGLPAGLTLASATGVISGTPTAGGVFNVALTATNVGGTSASVTLVLTVNGGPTITTQPQSQTMGVGGTVTLFVVATGTPAPTYQWKKAGNPISGATNASFTLSAVALSDADAYTVTVSNLVANVTSSSATLTVNSGPAITTQPVSDTVTAGANVTFSVVATGTPAPTYQWRKGGVAISGATSSTYVLNSVQSSAAGSYDVVVTNTVGSVTSSAATLIVNTGPVITTQPSANASYVVGNAVTLSVVATGLPTPTYQWRKGGVDLPGKTAASFTIAAVSLADAGSYSVVVTNSVSTVTSNAVSFLVYQPPTILAQPAVQNKLTGETATFSVVVAGDPSPTLQWRKNGLNIAGATGTTLTLANLTFDQAGSYSVYVSNPGGSVTSSGAALTVNPVAPVITSPSSVLGVRGLPLTYQITTAATAVDSYSASGLPAGLTLNAATGQISGTPTSAGTTAVTITASNVTGNDSRVVSFVINPPSPVVTSAAAASGRVATAFSFAVAASNTPTSYAAVGLPPGLSLASGTGVISGTPTQAGVYDVTVTATNAGGSGSSTLQITIDPPPNAPAFTGSTALSAVQGSAFTFTPAFTGSPFTAAFTATGLPSGITLSNAGTGAISGTPTVTGTFTVTITATNAGGTKSVDFSLVVNPAPSAPVVKSASTAVATVGSAFTFTLTSQGTPAATSYQAVGLPANGLSLAAATGVISGLPTQPGTLTLQVSAANNVGTGPASALVITINPSPNAPVISSMPIATGQVGVPFTYQLTASNSPTGFLQTAGTLPAGLTFNAASGAVTGTPTEAVEKRVWFAGDSLTNGRGFAMEVVFKIAPPPTAPEISSNGTAAGQVGQPFQYQITATNSPTSFAATGLPDGLSLSAASGLISGLPAKAGTFSVTLTASKGTEVSDPKTLSLTIQPAPATPVITSALSALGRAGAAFSYATTASENPTSYVASGLPAGLSMVSASGVVSGTPTVSGTFTVTLRAANAAGMGAESNLVITLGSALNAPAITSSSSVTGKVGSANAISYQTVAAPGPITAYALSGKLPLGLIFNTSTGLLSGNPAEAGVFTVKLTATNEGGVSNPQDLVINVAPSDNVPVITSPTATYGTVGVAFTYQISASALPAFPAAPFPAPFLLDAFNLPTGLAVNPSTGLIQGTPTVSGTFTASLVGSNSAGTGQPRSLSIVIDPAPTAPVVTSVVEVSAQAGVNFSYQITATEKPTSFEVLGAPVWMVVNSTTGAITGIPASPGVVTVDLVAKNASGASKPAKLTLSIAAAALAPVVTSSRDASGTVQSAFSYQITALVPTGGTAVTSYLATGLPSGLSINSVTGVISGTPLASGTFSVLMVAKNAAGESLPVTLALKIDPNITFNF